jgi:hypothetical protein
MALLHKYLTLLRGKDHQLKALIDQTLYNKAFRRVTVPGLYAATGISGDI